MQNYFNSRLLCVVEQWSVDKDGISPRLNYLTTFTFVYVGFKVVFKISVLQKLANMM